MGARTFFLAMLIALGGAANLAAITVADTTGWNAWQTNGTTRAMTDPVDSGLSTSVVDFTGGISQQAGALNGAQSIMWQVQAPAAAITSKGAFTGTIGIGVGLVNDPNTVNFVMLLSAPSSGANGNGQVKPVVQFASIGSTTNGGATASTPQTLTWATAGNAAGTAAASDALSAGTSASSTYNSSASTGLVTFALSYASLQQAIQAYAGTTFSGFVVDDFTQLNFVAFTASSATTGAVNGDLFGTVSTNNTSTATFTTLGMGTALIRPGGGPIPEPSTIYQLGGFISVGLLGFLWRRRRAASRAV